MPDHPRAGGVLTPGARRWLVQLALLAILLVAGIFLVRMVGEVDWDAVGDALGDLAWWQLLLLLGLLALRQLCGALPLSLYVPGVSPFQAVLNDQVGILLSSFAPPPSDLAARTAMFSSWGVPIPVGVAGTTLNTLTLFVVRFGAPAGAIVLSLLTSARLGAGWVDLICIAASITILVVLLLVVRSDDLARGLGLTGGRIVRRVRPAVDPEAWASTCVAFRGNVAANFHRGFRGSLAATLGMLVADGTMLVLCLRFVGVSTAEVGLASILIAYLFAFPLTLFPFFGLGLVDAIIITAVADATVGVGDELAEASAVAGLIMWRVFNTGGPVVLGIASLIGWRASSARRVHAS